MSGQEKYIEEASYWHSRFESGEIAEAEKAAFQLWLQKDARHEQTFNEMEELSAKLGSAELMAGSLVGDKDTAPGLHDSIYEAANLVVIHRKKKKLQTHVRQAMAVAAVFLVAFLVQLQWNIFSADNNSAYSTAIGEQKTVMLSDGSLMTLNTNSAISVAMTDDLRRLQLQKGEVFFEVAKDKERPFEVAVGGAFVRAIGTAFNIRRDEKKISVLVTEGKVEVIQPIKPAIGSEGKTVSKKPLEAGYQLTLSHEGIEETKLAQEAITDEVLWRQGRLIMDQVTVAEIVQKIQPYVAKKIIIADENVAALMAGGVFEVGDIQSFFSALEVALPVDVVHEEGVILLLRRNVTAS